MWKKMQFQTKLILAVSAVISFVMILSAVILYQIMLQNTWNNWERSNQQIFNSLYSSIDNQIDYMDTVNKNIHASAVVKNIFQNIPAQAYNYFDQNPLSWNAVYSEIYSALGSRPINGQIMIISRYGDYVYVDNQSGDITLSPDQALATEEVRWGLSTDEYVHVSLSESDAWHIDHEPVLSVSRPLRTSYETLGVIIYSVPLSALDRICQSYVLSDDMYIALLNEQQQPLYEYKTADYADTVIDWPDILNGYKNAKNSKMHLLFQSIRYSDLQLVQAIELRPFYHQIYRICFVLIVGYFLALICVLLITNFLLRQLFVPLQTLRREVEHISLDSEPLITANHRQNEISALSTAISEMLHRFRIQNERLLLARERDLQSTLNAMEAQLNSHFLYNTLAVIGAAGQMEGSPTTPRLCAKLSNLLRYSVDFNFKSVTLRDEFSNVRDYLDIMAIRYAGKTDFNWDLDPNTDDIQVPKLILQPIVENCFKHGFDMKSGMRCIRIISRCDEQRWFVEVRNNGEPISQEARTKLYETFAQYRSEIQSQKRLDARNFGTGFGLGNTILRLFLFYKGEEIFCIDVDGEETVVKIGGPIYAP